MQDKDIPGKHNNSTSLTLIKGRVAVFQMHKLELKPLESIQPSLSPVLQQKKVETSLFKKILYSDMLDLKDGASLITDYNAGIRQSDYLHSNMELEVTNQKIKDMADVVKNDTPVESPIGQTTLSDNQEISTEKIKQPTTVSKQIAYFQRLQKEQCMQTAIPRPRLCNARNSPVSATPSLLSNVAEHNQPSTFVAKTCFTPITDNPTIMPASINTTDTVTSQPLSYPPTLDSPSSETVYSAQKSLSDHPSAQYVDEALSTCVASSPSLTPTLYQVDLSVEPQLSRVCTFGKIYKEVGDEPTSGLTMIDSSSIFKSSENATTMPTLNQTTDAQFETPSHLLKVEADSSMPQTHGLALNVLNGNVQEQSGDCIVDNDYQENVMGSCADSTVMESKTIPTLYIQDSVSAMASSSALSCSESSTLDAKNPNSRDSGHACKDKVPSDSNSDKGEIALDKANVGLVYMASTAHKPHSGFMFPKLPTLPRVPSSSSSDQLNTLDYPNSSKAHIDRSDSNITLLNSDPDPYPVLDESMHPMYAILEDPSTPHEAKVEGLPHHIIIQQQHVKEYQELYQEYESELDSILLLPHVQQQQQLQRHQEMLDDPVFLQNHQYLIQNRQSRVLQHKPVFFRSQIQLKRGGSESDLSLGTTADSDTHTMSTASKLISKAHRMLGIDKNLALTSLTPEFVDQSPEPLASASTGSPSLQPKLSQSSHNSQDYRKNTRNTLELCPTLDNINPHPDTAKQIYRQYAKSSIELSRPLSLDCKTDATDSLNSNLCKSKLATTEQSEKKSKKQAKVLKLLNIGLKEHTDTSPRKTNRTPNTPTYTSNVARDVNIDSSIGRGNALWSINTLGSARDNTFPFNGFGLTNADSHSPASANRPLVLPIIEYEKLKNRGSLNTASVESVCSGDTRVNPTISTSRKSMSISSTTDNLSATESNSHKNLFTFIKGLKYMRRKLGKSSSLKHSQQVLENNRHLTETPETESGSFSMGSVPCDSRSRYSWSDSASRLSFPTKSRFAQQSSDQTLDSDRHMSLGLMENPELLAYLQQIGGSTNSLDSIASDPQQDGARRMMLDHFHRSSESTGLNEHHFKKHSGSSNSIATAVGESVDSTEILDEGNENQLHLDIGLARQTIPTGTSECSNFSPVYSDLDYIDPNFSTSLMDGLSKNQSKDSLSLHTEIKLQEGKVKSRPTSLAVDDVLQALYKSSICNFDEHQPSFHFEGLPFDCSNDQLAFVKLTPELICKETVASISKRERILSGYLHKLGSSHEISKSQLYFILSSEYLHAFQSQDATEPLLEYLHLTVTSAVVPIEVGSPSEKFVLHIKGAGSSGDNQDEMWYLQCKDKADMLVWLHALKSVISREKYFTAALPPTPVLNRTNSAPTCSSKRSKTPEFATKPISKSLSPQTINTVDGNLVRSDMSNTQRLSFSEHAKGVYRTAQIQVAMSTLPDLHEHQSQEESPIDDYIEFPITARCSRLNMTLSASTPNLSEHETNDKSKTAPFTPEMVRELRRSMSGLKASDSLALARMLKNGSSNIDSISQRPRRPRPQSTSSISSALAMLDAIEARERKAGAFGKK